jgi:hypothetical protein
MSCGSPTRTACPDADVICEGTVDDLLIEAGRASDDSDVMNAWIAM